MKVHGMNIRINKKKWEMENIINRLIALDVCYKQSLFLTLLKS